MKTECGIFPHSPKKQGHALDLLGIHDEYFERIRRFALSVLKDTWAADDVSQETFIRVNRNIHSLRDPSRLSAWIFRIAWNLCMDHKRAQTENQGSDALDDLPCGLKIHDNLEQAEMSRCVQSKIEKLPEIHRVPLILFEIEGFSHAEVADVLDISIENAKVRLHRAKTALRTILENECRFEHDQRGVFVCIPARDNN
jgi:RNA polymerase sigma-70 factor (ECF subfamily)